jgi:hypothetical protein
MNQVAWQIFGGSKLKANTFIGGVASTITTSGALATKLEIASNRITNFKIVGSDIECRISGSYVIPDSCFRSDTSITYYYDYENCTLINYRAFRDCTNLSEVVFDNVTYIDSQAFYKSVNLKKAILKSVITIGFQAFDGDGIISKLSTLYAPNCTILGGTIGFDFVFRNQLNVIFYCHPSLATNNAGAPDGDITNTAFSNKVIPRYVTNYTPPSSITNLSVGNVYGTAVKLNFTAPSSTNVIDYYECYANGVYKNTITSSGEYVTGLTLNTAYTFQLIPVDIFYNKSTSNVVSATTVTSSVPTTGLVSYYKLDSNSNDNWGSNNGTDTSVSYVAGKIGNAGSYNGTTSKTVIGNPANLQLSTGTISCWIKASASGGSYRSIFGKTLAYNMFLLDGVLIVYNWSSYGTTGNKSTGINLNDNLWHHIAFVFESGTALNYLYIDGVLKLTFSWAVLNQSDNFCIGSSNSVQNINALIDEGTVHNAKLTQTEIDMIYNSGNGTTL